MKTIISTFTLLVVCALAYGQSKSHQLSSHILNITTGQPAADVVIKLEKLNDKNQWEPVSVKKTDANGRVGDFLPYDEAKDNKGTYKLIFETYPYFTKHGGDSFYPFVAVVFAIKDQAHYHVPITISPYGYATYKGN
ncbi:MULTISPECIES: hydroxyisourate hydrolase [Sphingobacterium]|uniref:hydroxyisourate hydrolase n=1 Tax=Sphingobacterium TaxID=28453 RepID=UPI0013DA4A30|nr:MULTISPECIES: hydroxyisourate hydrolase [unclassified Sphingobacterium]